MMVMNNYKSEAADYRDESHIAYCMGEDCIMSNKMKEAFPHLQSELKSHILNIKRRESFAFPATIINQSENMVNAVFNVITKEKFFHQTREEDFKKALEEMKVMCQRLGVDSIVLQMPKDINKRKVISIMKNVFGNFHIEITLCHKEE